MLRPPMPADDLDQIMAIMATAFHPDYNEAWSRAQVCGALLAGNCHYYLVSAAGTLPGEGDSAAGFVLLRTLLDEEELLLFAVDPQYRRQGLGTKLLQRAKADARARGISRILLEMRQGNSAEALYFAQDFKRIGVRPRYYRCRGGDWADAITFACALR